MRTPWPYVVVAAAIAVSAARGADVQADVSADGATTEATFFPKKNSATWNQDDEKEGELEGELHLLGQADPTDPYDPLEELDDTDQQRDRPTDDEDDDGSDVTVTTLVPTATTEEDTRVDEPTDRGPAEPTKENGVTVTMVMEQSAPSATLSPDRMSEQTNGTDAVVAAASDNNSNEDAEESEEEELEAIKRQMKEDDLIPVPNPMNEEANQEAADIGDELDQLDDSDEDGNDAKPEEKEHGGEEARSGPEVASSAVSPVGQRPESFEELLSRSTRRVQDSPHAGQFPAKMNEDVVELMARLSEKPRSWARISNLLGKLDYESSSQLKSALQIQALRENQATEASTKHNNNNMKHVITAAKLASLPPSNQAFNSASGKEHHSNHHLAEYDHHPNGKPKIPGKHKLINNKLGLKQLTTANGRHGSGNMHVPPNTIHVQWEKNRKSPIAQDILPVHANSHLHYLAHKVGGQQTASSWYDANRPVSQGGPGKGGAAPNAGVKPLVSPHQNPGMKEGKPRPLGYPYRGPISTLAVDVPGQEMLNNKYPGGEKNNQAFIAVSVYKPKDSYRQVDLSPKMNGLPLRYPSSMKSKGFGNSNFAMEKPVTVVGPPAIELAPVRPGSKGFKNHKGKGRNKGAKAKQKGKNGMLAAQAKAHRARKLKYRNKMATDEIEAQLLALSKMERKLKQHLMQKEKLRQRMRMKHDQRSVRSPREVASFM